MPCPLPLPGSAAGDLVERRDLARLRPAVDVPVGEGADHRVLGGRLEVELRDHLVGEARDRQRADRARQRHVDAEGLLEVHGEFEQHQRIEPDLAERPGPADLVLAGVEHAGELPDDDVGQLAPHAVEAFLLGDRIEIEMRSSPSPPSRASRTKLA